MLSINDIGKVLFEKEFNHNGEVHVLKYELKELNSIEKIRLVKDLRSVIGEDLDVEDDDDEKFEKVMDEIACKQLNLYKRLTDILISVDGVSFNNNTETWSDLSFSDKCTLMESIKWRPFFFDPILDYFFKRDKEVQEEQGKSETTLKDT